MLEDYYQLIEQRFSNPKIGDTMRRLCLDGSNRQPKFIIPTIADRLKAGESVAGLALESALWCRYCFGTTDSGAVIANPTTRTGSGCRRPRRRRRPIPAHGWPWPTSMARSASRRSLPTLSPHNLKTLWEIGTRQTLTRYLSGAL